MAMVTVSMGFGGHFETTQTELSLGPAQMHSVVIYSRLPPADALGING